MRSDKKQMWRCESCGPRLTVTNLLERPCSSPFVFGEFSAAGCRWQRDHGGGHCEVWSWVRRESVLAVVELGFELDRERGGWI